MKKMMMMAMFGLMLLVGINASAQQDSATIAEEPQDTISIDNMDPTFYEEEAPEESSDTLTYALVGGIVVIGGAAFYFIRKKKK